MLKLENLFLSRNIANSCFLSQVMFTKNVLDQRVRTQYEDTFYFVRQRLVSIFLCGQSVICSETFIIALKIQKTMHSMLKKHIKFENSLQI